MKLGVFHSSAVFALAIVMFAGSAHSQSTVTGRIDFALDAKTATAATSRQAVIWLTPLDGEAASLAPSPKTAVLMQKDKTFRPHVLVIPAGSTVQFPNRDPFFHNVFSLFEGKRFDLGMYEAGSSRNVQFDRPGISYIFCNIHPEMSAVVVAVRTPFYATTDPAGNFSIANVPAGRYQMELWADGATPEALQTMTRLVSVGESATSVGTLHVQVAALAHKNKYGRDYDPTANAPYDHP
jgi:plastocyanin